MSEPHFRCVSPSGDEQHFDDASALAQAYSTGHVGPETLLFDVRGDRWMLLRDHEAVRGLDPPPVGQAVPAGLPIGGATQSGAGASVDRTAGQSALGAPARTTAPAAGSYWRVGAISAAAMLLFGYLMFLAVENDAGKGSGPGTAVSNEAVQSREIHLSGIVANYGTGDPRTRAINGTLDLYVYPPDGHTHQLVVGPPLGGSGELQVATWGDTLLALSVNGSGDSIAWIAERHASRFSGSYVIIGGVYKGQGGRWWVGGSADDLRQLQEWTRREMQSTLVNSVRDIVRPFARRPLVLERDRR